MRCDEDEDTDLFWRVTDTVDALVIANGEINGDETGLTAQRRGAVHQLIRSGVANHLILRVPVRPPMDGQSKLRPRSRPMRARNFPFTQRFLANQPALPRMRDLARLTSPPATIKGRRLRRTHRRRP